MEIKSKLTLRYLAVCEHINQDPDMSWRAFFVQKPGLVSPGYEVDDALGRLGVLYNNFFVRNSRITAKVDTDSLTRLFTINNNRQLFLVDFDPSGSIIDKYELVSMDEINQEVVENKLSPKETLGSLPLNILNNFKNGQYYSEFKHPKNDLLEVLAKYARLGGLDENTLNSIKQELLKNNSIQARCG